MNRNWKQGFSLICCILLLLALAGCGEKTTNPDVPAPETASEQPVEQQEVETEAESETVSALGDLQAGPFPGALGTDPNTLFQTDGSMAFAEDVIYFSNRQTYLYQVNYDGTGLKQLDEEAMEPSCLNYYGGKLYYRCAKEVRCFDPETQQVEVLVRVEPGEDLRHSTTTYTAYSEINSVFVVDGLLFYTRTDGYNNTSELKFQRMYVRDLRSGEEQMILESDVSAPIYFSLDQDYLYLLAENMTFIQRMDRKDIQNGVFQTEETTLGGVKYDKRSTFLFAQNGFAYISTDESFAALHYSDFSAGSFMTVNKQVLYTGDALAGALQRLPESTNYLLGSSLISIRQKTDVLRYTAGEFASPESVETCDIPAASGIHDQTVYLIDREQKSGQPVGLVLIGETGAATRYSLQP